MLPGKMTLAKKPYLHDRVCGAVLIRWKDGSTAKESETSVLASGEICGMTHYPNLTARYGSEAGLYVVYADDFDPRIEDGWR
jgi:hypothetical protein